MDIKDFIKILEDNDIFIYPYADKKPKYDRSVIPHFVPRVKEYKMGQIIYGSTTPDIYTTLYIDGTVMLKHTDNRYDDTFDTGKFENFCLFKYGKPALDRILVHADKEAMILLQDLWCAANYVMVGNNKCYHLDLHKVTFDSYRGGEYKAYALCDLILQEFKEKAINKVLKYYEFKFSLDKFVSPDKSKNLKDKYDNGFIKILNENYITDKGYNQFFKSKSKPKEYDIKVKGLSNLPKVEDITERIRNDKKQTTAGSLMVETVQMFENDVIDNDIYDKMLESNEHNLETYADLIRGVKYGMFLDGKWFDEFTEKGDQEIQQDDWVFKIVYNGNNS